MKIFIILRLVLKFTVDPLKKNKKNFGKIKTLFIIFEIKLK